MKNRTAHIIFISLFSCMIPCAGVSSENLLNKITGFITDANKDKNKRFNKNLEMAQKFESEGNREDAIKSYINAIHENPNNKGVYSLWLKIGDIHLSQKQYTQAIESYNESLSISTKREDAHIRLANVYEISELYELSRQQYIEVLENNHKSFDANYFLAGLYLRQGLYGQSLEYYRIALTIESRPEIYRNAAVCAKNINDMELALAMLNQIDSSDRIYEDLINLGNIYKQKGKDIESERSFSDSIKLCPERLEGYIYLGLLYLENGDLKPAEKLFEIAAEKSSEEGIIYFFLANIHFRQGQLKLAEEENEKVSKFSKSIALKKYCERFSDFMDKTAAKRQYTHP